MVFILLNFDRQVIAVVVMSRLKIELKTLKLSLSFHLNYSEEVRSALNKNLLHPGIQRNNFVSSSPPTLEREKKVSTSEF